MAFTPLVTVAGIALPEPATYNGTTSTVVDSARNTQAVMIGAVIRDDMAKIEMTWKFLTLQQWASVLSRFKISTGGKFINSVTFLDQTTGTFVTRDMYVNDRKAGAWKRDSETKEIIGWTNCSLNLIEV